jgi:hypothetical protein
MSRRVVRHGVLDSVWDTVPARFPPELHPHLRRYVETRNAANEARSALTMAKIPHRIEWWRIDEAVRGH